jgi:hypothetical protein
VAFCFTLQEFTGGEFFSLALILPFGGKGGGDVFDEIYATFRFTIP